MRGRCCCCRCRWFVDDGVGIGCAVFTYILIAYGEFVVVFVMLLPDLTSLGWDLFHAVLFSCLSLLALVSHIRSMVTDPGTIPLGNCTDDNLKRLKVREGDVVLRCTRCECIKLDRAHHCSTCQRCIRKMDHHCPWINNCVGEDNQKFFILFTFYIMLISVYALLLAGRQLFICTEKDWQGCTFMPLASSLLLMIFLVFEGLLFGIFTLVMLCTQVTSIVRDETGIEYLKREKRFKHSTTYGNLQDVFGGDFSITWLSPFTKVNNRRSSQYFEEV